MREVGAPVTGRDQGVVDTGLGQRPVLEGLDLLGLVGRLPGREGVPGLVEQGGPQVLGGGVCPSVSTNEK